MHVITENMITELIAKAASYERKRAIYRLHEHEEPVQRMVNALLPGTYVTPHQHANPPKVELLSILRGSVAVLKFTSSGELSNVYRLGESSPVRIIDIAPGEFHSMIALEPAAVLEIVQGPFDAATHKQFADWAPLEGDPEAPDYLRQLEQQVAQFLQ